MILEDAILIDAAPTAVWDVLLDVDCLAACMPGVEQVTPIDERTFDGVITAAVGPINGKFAFRATIVDSDPPHRLTGQVEGTDSVTKSHIHAIMAMTLTASGDRTELAYRTDVDVQGRLAILGEMMLRATGTLIVEEFAKRLRAQVVDGATHPESPAAGAPAPGAGGSPAPGS